jgi:hypothetical protein
MNTTAAELLVRDGPGAQRVMCARGHCATWMTIHSYGKQLAATLRGNTSENGQRPTRGGSPLGAETVGELERHLRVS